MKKDKVKVLLLELLLIVILFFALFAPNIITRSILSMIMFLYMLFVFTFLKKRKICSIYKKQTTILMIVFGIIYVSFFYMLGLYFGFVRSKVLFSLWTVLKFILPLSIIIVSSEMIRNVLISQKINLKVKSKNIELSSVLTYVALVLVDLVIYTGIYDLTNLDDFLTAIGFVLFASLSCNLVYNYISKRYGSTGLIIYRLITTLFIYIIPITPDVYLFFRTFLRMVYPYIIYILFEKLYSRNDFVVAYNDKRNNVIGNTILFVIMILFIMLISCKFTLGILVVGSKSMTGSINKGDAVLFEKYDDTVINEGEIIIFNYNGIQTIHRVVKTISVNNEVRYYTKGDANSNMDTGYITADDIYGIVKFKIKYIGYPTLWVRTLFS